VQVREEILTESHPLSVQPALVELPVAPDLWSRVFTVAPLVVVGTVESDGYDLAPKHMAMPLSWEGFYGFVCAPTHATYRNLLVHPEFTVSFPGPEQVVQASLAAAGRFAGGVKPSLAAVTTLPARVVGPPLVDGCVLYLECELDRMVDGLGPNSLVVGRVVSASAPREALRGPEVDDADLVHELGLLAYLAPGRFAAVRDSLAFPYPLDFKR
jgi:flavin reductase (DIM6/NTAB) family NADH-FMN oxidoreductase RutF